MTLVSHCAWSMLSEPLVRVKPADRSGHDVSYPLGSFGMIASNCGTGTHCTRTIIQIAPKQRSAIVRRLVPDMETVKLTNLESVFIPKERWKTDLPVDFIKFMYMFPCS
jgi:hypothetical protein